jgi:hypothetical protein
MGKKVRIDEIASAIGADKSEGSWYLDTESGATELVTDNIMDAVLHRIQFPADAPADVQLMYKVACEIVADGDGRFMKLPGQLDVLEWDIMRKFASQLSDSELSENLQEDLRGANAFQAFQMKLRKHRLQGEWNEFRERALRDVAREWCNQHEIAYE